MNTQLNRPLSIAVLQTRNGEVPGFEDLYLLTCRNTLADIRATVSDEEKVWSIFREVYKQIWERRESIPEAGILRPWIRVLLKEEARKQGVLIGEFAAETDREPVKVGTGREDSFGAAPDRRRTGTSDASGRDHREKAHRKHASCNTPAYVFPGGPRRRGDGGSISAAAGQKKRGRSSPYGRKRPDEAGDPGGRGRRE